MVSGKKLIYISNVNIEGIYLLGVIEKIKGQVNAFRKKGLQVDILFPRENGVIVIRNNNLATRFYKGARDIMTEKGLLHKLMLYLKNSFFGNINFSYCLNDFLKENYDVVYLRFYLPGRDLIRFIKAIKKERPQTIILLEYPTINVKETFKKSLSRKISFYINVFNIKKLNKLSDYIITLTKDKALFGKPAIQMPNGIDLDEIKPVPLPEFHKSLVLIGVTSDCAFYHGFDKVIRGLELYKKGNPDIKVIFRIISNPLSTNVDRLKKLVIETGTKDNVIFEEPKSRMELAEEYKGTHMGVGTLALHRIGLMDNYSLKHREYSAFGLPFVMSKGDDHFEHCPFVLLEERDDHPIDIKRIVDFYISLRQNYPDYPRQFRKSVESLVTWDIQMKGIFSVIENGKPEQVV